MTPPSSSHPLISSLHKNVYVERRRRLLSTMPSHSLMFLFASDEWLCSGDDILHPHQQNDLFYHFFGYTEPMRRALAPSASIGGPADMQMTFACFMKPFVNPHTAASTLRSSLGVSNGNEEGVVALFVLQRTSDPDVMVWSSQEETPQEVERCLLRCNGKDSAHPTPTTTTTGTGRDAADHSLLSDHDAAYSNHLPTVVIPVLLRYLHAMTTVKCERDMGVNHMLHHLQGPSLRQSLRALQPLPSILLDLPLQMRFGGGVPSQFSIPIVEEEEEGSASTSLVFSHPLQLLLHALSSVDCRRYVELGESEGTPNTFTGTHQAHEDSLVKPHGEENGVALRCLHSSYVMARDVSVLLSQLWTPSSSSSVTKLRRRYPSLCSHVWPVGYRRRVTSMPPHSDPPLRLPPSHLSSARDLLACYRAVKSPAQIVQHLRSAAATAYAFQCLFRQASQPHTDEYVLQCAFDGAILDLRRVLGPCFHVRSAYIPVIGSGRRSFYIHYTENSAMACEGGSPGCPVRVDAGVQVDYVPTDCTRSFPIRTSSFTPDSTPMYQPYMGILALQRQLLQFLRVGVSLADIDVEHVKGTTALVHELLRGEAGGESRVSPADVRRIFCAHRFGHPFGIAIHEPHPVITAPFFNTKLSATTERVTSRVMMAGMVYTVEPGLYLPDDAHAASLVPSPNDSESGQRLKGEGEKWRSLVSRIPTVWRGMGVQVEDDVLILPSRHDEASTACSPSQFEIAAGMVAAKEGWRRCDYLWAAARAVEDQDRILRGANAESIAALNLWNEEGRCTAQLSSALKAEAEAGKPWVWRYWLCTLVRLVFAQRIAIEGLSVAESHLQHDMLHVKEVCGHIPCRDGCPSGSIRAAPPLASEGGVNVSTDGMRLAPPPWFSGSKAWYPYDILVLTACIPKDPSILQEYYSV